MPSDGAIKRMTGLLVIEVVNSNPNGDPDREGDPRQRDNGRGLISPVSFKRKIRDLVLDKDGPVWSDVAKSFKTSLDPARFEILEHRGRDREQVVKEAEEGTFTPKYWDARLFGSTFLEAEAKSVFRTGVVQFGLGVSVAPIEIERMTTTSMAGVEADLDRGMAPMAYRIVPHGVYAMPFFVNPTSAGKSKCTAEDVELLLKVIPFAYPHTASYLRPFVGIRHAWCIEHKSALGSCSDFELVDGLTPMKKSDPDKPSTSWADYDVPSALPVDLQDRVAGVRDLMAP